MQRPYKRIEKRLAGQSKPTTTAEVSARMSRVRQQGTSPEIMVRKIATAAGLHYRVRNRDLPGSPDIANRKHKFAVFVHGCYWHRHRGCKKATTPKSNVTFWQAKFARNVERDATAVRSLRSTGYKVVIIWECDARDKDHVERAIAGLRSKI